MALGIWHTSSKGMPRHAYGRWALMFGCGSRLNKKKHLRQKPFNLTKVLVFFAVAIRQTQLTLVYLVKSIKHVNFTRHLATYIPISPEREMECTQLHKILRETKTCMKYITVSNKSQIHPLYTTGMYTYFRHPD